MFGDEQDIWKKVSRYVKLLLLLIYIYWVLNQGLYTLFLDAQW